MKLLSEQYQAILARRDFSQEEIKRRIARKIHDEVSQKLTVLSLELSLITMKPQAIKKAELWRKLDELTQIVSDVSRTVRNITSELRPKVLDEFGLVAALQWYSKNLDSQAPFEVVCPNDEMPLSIEAASVLFSASKEILHDILEHRPECPVCVEILDRKKNLDLIFSGVPPQKAGAAAKDRAAAMLSVRERVARFGGTVKIKRATKKTLLTLSVPASRVAAGAGAKKNQNCPPYGKDPDS